MILFLISIGSTKHMEVAHTTFKKHFSFICSTFCIGQAIDRLISILFILCNGLVVEKPREAVRNAPDIPTLQRFLFFYLFYLDKRPIHVEI